MSSQYFRILARAPIEPRRSALLEQLLARADAAKPVNDWRADAFRIMAPQAVLPAIAPAALCADGGAADAAWVCLATPVHYVAEMTSVRLSEDGILSMKPEAAATDGALVASRMKTTSRTTSGRNTERCRYQAPNTAARS